MVVLVWVLLSLTAAARGQQEAGGRGYGAAFFELLTTTLQPNSSSVEGTGSSKAAAAKIHLLRIPKASSSSLSIVARRMVGCEPPGPCCKWPGDPPGSCPAKGLFACQTEGRVIGCTHHYPNYDALLSPSIVSISIMREPWRRAVSAFFYPGIHHNSKCAADVDTCFREYALSTRWRNVAVKMLTGAYAYDDRPTCRDARQCKHSLELARHNLERLAVMGVAEMWELSLLLLHLKMPQLRPELSEFLIGEKYSPASPTTPAAASSSLASVSSTGSRVNAGDLYQSFRTRAFATASLRQLLHGQSELDAELYQEVLGRMCDELHTQGLWKQALVRQYWQAKNIARNVSRCP